MPFPRCKWNVRERSVQCPDRCAGPMALGSLALGVTVPDVRHDGGGAC